MIDERRYQADAVPFPLDVRVWFYRVLAPGMTKPDREWHRMRQLHLDAACARRHLHRKSTLVRQKFRARDVPAGQLCAFCCGLFRAVWGRYRLPDVRYQEMQDAWQRQFTLRFEVVLDPCEAPPPAGAQ